MNYRSPVSTTRALPAVLALLALLLPGTALAATKPAAQQKLYPSIAKVAPKEAGIGDRMTITGKGFRKGKNRNTVVFKREGKRAIFVRATGSTTKKITVVLPAKLLPMLAQKKGTPVATRFRVRVLAARFGKRYTSVKTSPLIGPTPRNVKVAKDDCDGDGTKNATDKDDDNDLLTDDEEAGLKTDSCVRDTDGDGMSDGWEYYSALDRNGKAKPAPTRKPYPNALDKEDAAVDHDGDGLTNLEEYVAWVTISSKLRAPDADVYTSRLTYSGGNPNSDGRARRSDSEGYMDRDNNGYLSDFERDADGDLIPNMDEQRGSTDAARDRNPDQADDDPRFYEYGLFGQTYLDKVAEVQSKQEQPSCGGINQVPFYCLDGAEPSLAVSKVDTLDWVDADSDGDGIRDDQDDVDHDDVANITEYLDEIAAAPSQRNFRQLDACIPNVDARYCLIGTIDVDRDGIANRDDPDDDGDVIDDAREIEIGTKPLIYDTDGDGIGDGFEYYSALDLNSVALPYPGKKPYPNALDAEDADFDHDGDGLTLRQEQKAWRYGGGGVPLSYSDGAQWTGGKAPAASYPPGTDADGNGTISDDEKDVDQDGLSNYVEANGPLSSPEWWDKWIEQVQIRTAYGCQPKYYTETAYPAPKYAGMNFVDPDTDGDGLKDGADDIDHDGLTNVQEIRRPANWCRTYVSIGGPANDPGHNWNGSAAVAEFGLAPDPYARVQPFNPCKPINSDACHIHAPFGYYKEIPASDTDGGWSEDWESPITP